MTHFFERRDRWGHGLALWILVAMVFLIPPAIWSVKQIHMHNNIRSWLPSDDPQARTLNWYLASFPHKDRVLISWEGSTLNDPRATEFAERLNGIEDEQGIRRNGLKLIDSVVTPHDLIAKMMKYDVDLDEAIRRLQGVLIGTGKLKLLLTEAGRKRKDAVVQTLKERTKLELNLQIEIHEPEVEWSETAEALAFNKEDSDDDTKATQTFPDIPEHDFQVRWDGMQSASQMVQQFQSLARSMRDAPQGTALVEDCFFASGTPVALSVVLSEAGVADKSGTLLAIRRIGKEVGIKPDQLHMAGGPVVNSAMNQAVKKAAWNPIVAGECSGCGYANDPKREQCEFCGISLRTSVFDMFRLHERSIILLSGLVGIVLAFVMLRSARLAILVLVVSYYTVLLTVSLVPVTGGSMNMVLVVMPSLLLVLTLSSAIHVANYWKHSAHQDVRTAVVKATQMARQPCTLASLTTAIGLLSLLTSSLTPVRHFGLYSAVGCLIALLVVLYGLPALLQFWPVRSQQVVDIDRSGWEFLGNKVARYKLPVSIVAIVLFVGSSYGLRWFKTETKAIRYFPDSSVVVRDYWFLEENLSGIVPFELIVCFDENMRDKMNFLERMEVIRQVEEKVRQHPEISGTLSLASFRPVSKQPPDDANFLVKARYNKTANVLETRIREGDVSGVKSFISFSGNSIDLPISDSRRLRIQEGDELWRVTAQVALMSDLNYSELITDEQTGHLDEIVKSVLKYHSGAQHVVTGMVPVFLKTQQAVLDSLIWSFGLAFCVIALVMIILLKDLAAGFMTMLPNLMPVGVIFGLISWSGMPVDIGTMITASVALGIAVDETIHLLTWFRAGITNGRTRRKAIQEALARCGPAMWHTSLAVGIGLLMLYPANLLLISRFGWLMASLIGAALVANVIFLPALLAGPLGMVLMKATVVRQKESRSSNSTLPESQPPDSRQVQEVLSHHPEAGQTPQPHTPFAQAKTGDPSASID